MSNFLANIWDMKNIIFSVLVLCCFYKISFSQTQSEMTYSADEADKKVYKKMDSIYKMVLKVYAKDTLFIKNLKRSQKLWAQYNNAQISVMFPDYGKDHYYSMLPMCISEYSRQLAIDRIHELEQWLIGYDEEGGCTGSVKRKEELPTYKPFLNDSADNR